MVINGDVVVSEDKTMRNNAFSGKLSQRHKATNSGLMNLPAKVPRDGYPAGCVANGGSINSGAFFDQDLAKTVKADA